MIIEVQLNVHTFVDNEGGDHCHEKKIVSGDNKTEKNMHYGILRLTCNTINIIQNLLNFNLKFLNTLYSTLCLPYLINQPSSLDFDLDFSSSFSCFNLGLV